MDTEDRLNKMPEDTIRFERQSSIGIAYLYSFDKNPQLDLRNVVNLINIELKYAGREITCLYCH